MRRLYVLWNVWNEADNLHAAMNSVETCIGDWAEIRHIIVDGRYPNHPGDSDTSNDGTFDIAEQRGFEAMEFSGTETQKLNMLLRLAELWAEEDEEAWLLRWDADERMETFTHPRATTRVGTFNFYRESDSQWYMRNKLFRYEYGLNFQHSHKVIFDRDGYMFTDLTNSPRKSELTGVGLHKDLPRDNEREVNEAAYYKWLQEYEAKGKGE